MEEISVILNNEKLSTYLARRGDRSNVSQYPPHARPA
jgi:hypothetical protein